MDLHRNRDHATDCHAEARLGELPLAAATPPRPVGRRALCHLRGGPEWGHLRGARMGGRSPLSPGDYNLGPWLAFAGMAELHLGHQDEAASRLARAIETGSPVAGLAAALALAGRADEAKTALGAFRQSSPSSTIARLQAQAPSTDPGFVAQQERFFEGLRLAGLLE